MKTHLFVLAHGLWGGAGHLQAVEDIIHKGIATTDPQEVIATVRPKTSSLFKTYDGVEIIGQRMLLEVLHEIKRLFDEGMVVWKISFVGYSLGGIISRYMIGELEKLGIFDFIQPMYFTTFATPHLGVWFFKKRFQILNILGANMIGKIGSELFIKDNHKIFVKLSEGDYLAGLQKFKQRYTFANIRHDRTVNFYTSYITDKNPFDEHWDQLELSFEFDEDVLPTYSIRGITVKPKIVNMMKSSFRSTNYKPKKIPFIKRLRFMGIILLVCCIFPIWIPLVFTVSSIGSIVSYFIVKTFKKKNIQELKEILSPERMSTVKVSDPNSKNERGEEEEDDDGGSTLTRQESFSSTPGLQERLDEVTSEAFENAINIGQYDTNTESARDRYNGERSSTNQDLISTLINKSKQLIQNVEIFQNPNILQYEIFRKSKQIPLNDDRQLILHNLNGLNWNKFGIYVNVLNAHDGIVARKGLKRGTVKGIAGIYFWAQLINEQLKIDNNTTTNTTG